MTPEQKILFDQALAVRKHAYAPYSKFPVGASLITSQGHIYSGCNVENAAYPLSLCAEMNAITKMISSGETNIHAILIIGGHDDICPPCGSCRQVLREFASLNTPIYLSDPQGKQCITKTLEELLPLSFGPENLL